MLKVFGVRLWVAICLVIGIALTIGCYPPWRLESQIAADPCIATGRIDSLTWERGSKGAITWQISYSFTVDGQWYSNQVAVSQEKMPASAKLGQEIHVRYYCANPEFNRPTLIPPRLNALRLGLSLGIICLIVGIVFAAGDLTGKPMRILTWRKKPRPNDQELLASTPPTGFNVQADNGKRLVIEYSWLNGRRWLLVIAALFIAGMLGYQIWLWGQCPNSTAMSWLFYSISALTIAACIIYAATNILGRTVITANRHGVEVASRPSLTSSFSIKSQVIKEFIARQQMRGSTRKGGIPIGKPTYMRPTGWYEVVAICTNGTKKTIVRNCSSEQHARWLAVKLNSFFSNV